VQVVASDGKVYEPPSAAQRRLLAVLAVHAPRALRAEFLSQLLDVSPGGLRTTVSRLRRILGDALHTDAHGYRLDAQVDSVRFVELVTKPPAGCDRLDQLDEALGGWHGEVLDEFRHESWAVAEVARLDELRSVALETKAELLIARERPGEAVVTLEPHINAFPLRDQPRGLLMRALAEQGRQAEALRVYDTYRRYLADEVGTEPSAGVRAIERRIASGSAGTDGPSPAGDLAGPAVLAPAKKSGFPLPARRPVSTMVSIPSPRTSLVGRATAVIEIRKLVAEHPLVTLTGVGGCGKTRLAIEVAACEAPGRPDGVWFVDLASVADGTAVPGTVAAVLDLVTDTSTSTTSQIAAYLAARDALLVVDNCEHLLDEVAELVDVLLDHARNLRVLTTSREALALDGEYTWRVPSLELGPGSAAVRLFEERAAAATGRFEPDRPTTDVVAEICERLDGIPLAIELAAARARTMGVAEIRDRLDDRFQLLSGGSPRLPQRQQTLEAAVQWSYDLLSTEEHAMLALLSVFRGGFDLVDVAAVAELSFEAAAELVEVLVAKSLIDVTRGGERLRYRLLDTIRLFALRHLVEAGAAEAARDRHLEHFLADRAIRDLGYAQETAGGLRIQREIENLRAAASWAIERDRPAAAAVIACALLDQLMLRGDTHQLVAWLKDDPELDRAERVRCFGSAGWVSSEAFDLIDGLYWVTRAIDAAGGEAVDYLPQAHCQAAKIHVMRRNLDLANDHLERGLTVARLTTRPDVNIATILIARSSVYASLGAFADSADAAAEALTTAPDTFTLRSFALDLRDLAIFFDGRDPPPRRGRREDAGPGELRLSGDFTSSIVDAVIASRALGPEVAAARLAECAGESAARRPHVIGDWLGAFAYVAALRGDADRARHLLSHSIALNVPAIRPATRALLPATEPRRFDASGNAGLDRVFTRAKIHQPCLLAQEIERWC
jgi:predicted ATPase/DNA-binding SARP family transcriptional activator